MLKSNLSGAPLAAADMDELFVFLCASAAKAPTRVSTVASRRIGAIAICVPLEIGYLNVWSQRTDLDGRTVPQANWTRFAPDLCQLLNSDVQPGKLLKSPLSDGGTVDRLPPHCNRRHHTSCPSNAVSLSRQHSGSGIRSTVRQGGTRVLCGVEKVVISAYDLAGWTTIRG
jgi:hypothetical protein